MFISCKIDDICLPDYYSGHGHAFKPDSLVGCLRFGVAVCPEYTVKEVVDAILDDAISTWDLEVFDPRTEIWEETIAEVSRSRLKDCLKDEIGYSDRLFIEEYDIFIENETDDPEYPYIYGYFHFFKENWQ